MLPWCHTQRCLGKCPILHLSSHLVPDSWDHRYTYKGSSCPNLLQWKRQFKERSQPFCHFPPSIIFSAWSSVYVLIIFPNSLCSWREIYMLFRNNTVTCLFTRRACQLERSRYCCVLFEWNICTFIRKLTICVWIILVLGLDGALGWWCILELSLFTHPYCDNVLMEAISE